MAHDPTIFIVDGDQAVSDSLQALLESFGFRVEIYNSSEAFLEAYAPPGIGCLLMDLRLPDLDGQKFLEKLNTNLIDLPVIIITARSDVRLAVKAMQAGAVDFVEKPFEEKVILGSIDRALTLSAQARHEVSEVDSASALISRLTSRERDVLEELVFGRSNKAIALELGISPRTVEIHRAHVMEKMEARSLSHLVRLALVAGINP